MSKTKMRVRQGLILNGRFASVRYYAEVRHEGKWMQAGDDSGPKRFATEDECLNWIREVNK